MAAISCDGVLNGSVLCFEFGRMIGANVFFLEQYLGIERFVILLKCTSICSSNQIINCDLLLGQAYGLRGAPTPGTLRSAFILNMLKELITLWRKVIIFKAFLRIRILGTYLDTYFR